MAVGIMASAQAADTLCKDNEDKYSFEQKILASVDAKCDHLDELISVDDQVTREKLLQLKAVADGIGKSTTTSALVNRLNSGYLLGKTITGADEQILSEMQRYSTQMLTLKSSLVLVRELQKEAVKVLDLVSASLHYWIECQHHPVHYFFHKSPFKWSPFAQNQDDEIAANLKLLHHKQEKFYALLGKLSRHIESFSSVMTIDEHDAWLGMFFTTARLIVPRQKNRTALAVQDDKIQQFIALAEAVGACAQTRVIPGAVDGHVMLNWMTYCTAGIILTAGLLHVEKVKGMGATALESGKVFWNDFSGACKSLYGLVKPESLATFDEKTDMMAHELANYCKTTQIKSKEFPMGVDCTDDKKLKIFVLEFLRGECSTEDANKFKNIQEKRNTFSAEVLLTKKTQVVENLKVLYNTLDPKLKTRLGSLESIDRLVEDICNGKRDDQVIDIIETIISGPIATYYEVLFGVYSIPTGITPNVQLLLELWPVLTTRLQCIIQQNIARFKKLDEKVSLIIAAAIVGTGFYGTVKMGQMMYWLLKKSPHDFKPAREALLEVDRILNLHDNDNQTSTVGYVLSDSESGRLLYALERIKKEIFFVKEPDSWDFERDVRQLEFSSLLSIRQKRSLINIMYRQYEFLHLGHERLA